LVWDKTKFTLPTFDNSKMEWSNYATKIRAALCKCNMSYLLSDPATNSSNAKHSKELCLELYDKLTGPSLQLFKSLAAQDYYMEGGRGIEMIHLLAAMFNPMDSNKHRSLLLKLISATLPEDTELLEFINTLKDTNMQLSWCGTGMPEDLLVDIAMHRLENFLTRQLVLVIIPWMLCMMLSSALIVIVVLLMVPRNALVRILKINIFLGGNSKETLRDLFRQLLIMTMRMVVLLLPSIKTLGLVLLI
jgi:hypothetical protein